MPRHRVEIDPLEVEKLASFGLTQTEIAEFYSVHKSQISRRFGTEWLRGRAALKRSLRRKQIELALAGNVSMLIWLGKNILDQSDRQEQEHAGEIKIRVEYIDRQPATPASGAGGDQAEREAV